VNAVFELIAATVRWSRESEQSKFFFSGTLWYGMMCRNFLLLERILRSIAHELSALAPHDAERIASERAQGKAIERMTFGQCFSVVEGIVPIVSQRIYVICPELAAQTLLSDADCKLWKRVVSLRNRIAHHGPGFLDSVDLSAGRIWRSTDEREPPEAQAQEIWRVSKSLCKSPLVISYLALKGIAPDVTRAELMKVENSELEIELRKSDKWKTYGELAAKSINEFHAGDGLIPDRTRYH